MSIHNNNDEKGAALIIVLVVLVCVTLIGISVLNTSDFESKILSSFKNHEITFQLTDGSLAASSKMIHQVINKLDDIPAPSQFIVGSETDNTVDDLAAAESFKNKINDYESEPAAEIDIIYKYGDNGEENILMANVGVTVNIDFSRLDVKTESGSSAEFMQNASAGMQNRPEILYNMTATGAGRGHSRSVVRVIYGDVQ